MKKPDPGTTRPGGNRSVPVVGIGASAGGLEAFTLLLGKLPEKSGLAFVLVQHLDPTHDSHLTEILSRATSLPVAEVQDGMAVERDHVYVIPPNVSMALSKGVLHLSPREESHVPPMPIDAFLRSLAQDKHRHAIGVVLSGTGSDGTIGLSEIKAAGGITFAQDEESAKSPGMPRSAVAEGTVDMILPPGEIALELARIGGHAYFGHAETEGEEAPFPEAEGDFSRIIALLRAPSGVDFSLYRDSTLKRRILRRMALCRRETLAEYRLQLEGDEAELKALYQDILIHVTRFFRDPKAFQALSNTVFPQIVKGKSSGDTVRIWVVGCATGEEAYSMAIAFSEFQDGRKTRLPLRVFATDIDESPSLERARAGSYFDSIEQDVSTGRLHRFFAKEEGGYRISKEIREMCIFAKHDVTADPPFARLDLISCRNVLIYLSASLQRRILPAFHYALNPGGFLLLGSSETIGKDTDLFSPVDPQLKIYAKKMAARGLPILGAKDKDAVVGPPEKFRRLTVRPPSPMDFQQAADRLMLRKFAPPGVLVNKDGDILQFRGRTSPFLEPPQGGTRLKLDKMAQEGLSLVLRDALRESAGISGPVRRSDVRVLDGRMVLRVDLEILPIKLPDALEPCYLVLFEEATEQALPLPAKSGSSAQGLAEGEEVSLLRNELAAAREYLQTIREQCEAVNEELKASNEEMESSNEELQSTNEELETAKEELQSANEELATMNEELQTRNLELARLNDDLSNLFTSVQIPILLLGSDLRIRRFNPSAGETLRLTGADLGRPVGKVRFGIADFDIEKHISEVMADQKPAAREVRDQDGRWHALKIHPYRSSDDRIDGALVAMFDIDALKRTQQRLQESGDFARSIVDTVRDPLLILDEESRIQSANLSYYRLLDARPRDTEGLFLQEVSGGIWRIPELIALLGNPPGTGQGFEDFEVARDLPGGRRILMLNARRIVQDEGRTRMMLLAIEDITERRRAERELRLLKFCADQSPDPNYLMDREARFTYVNRSSCARLGYGEAELLSMTLYRVDPGCTGETFASLFERAHGSPIPPFESEHAAKDGGRFPVECSVTGVNFEGEAYMLLVARDISDRKRAEEALRQSEDRLRQAQRMEAIGTLAGGVAHDFNNMLTAINGYSALCLEAVPPEGNLHDNLAEISKAGERAAALTRQLLAYSRQQVLIADALDLNAVLANMHSMLGRLIGERHRLTLSLTRPLGLVKADRGQMEQVIVNLVVNARDAMPDGGEITLGTRIEELAAEAPDTLPPAPPGAYVVLSVADKGLGMDAEVQKRIFEPFFTTKLLGKGTGLGLSVVQGIISQTGGHIRLKSALGEGSAFEILLPRGGVRVSEAKIAKAVGGQSFPGTETVLLAEDEETVRNYTRQVLEMQGYSVLEAKSGEEAWKIHEKYKDTVIDILVTDMVMQGIGGRELAERFLAARPESKVLLMSGYTEDAVFSQNGFLPKEVHLLHKPFGPAELAKAVRETLDRALEPDPK